MEIKFSFRRRPHWINLPTATLLALLQRTPLVPVAGMAEEMITAPPIGAVLRSAAAAAAALGALNSLAGATFLVSNTGNPLSATVGTPIPTTSLSVLGTQSPASTYEIVPISPTPTIPAGLQFYNSSAIPTTVTGSGGPLSAMVPNPSGIYGAAFLSGTPTTAGTYEIGITAYEFTLPTGTGGTGIQSPVMPFWIVVSAVGAPTFSAYPASQTVNVGQSVTFSATVLGASSYQWQKNGTAISGATGATYTIASPALTDAGAYTVAAANGSGTITSPPAMLTVASTTAAPVFTLQPLSQPAVTQGTTVVFTVNAVGGNPSYQWQLNGANLTDGNNTNPYASTITGSQGPSLVMLTSQTGPTTSPTLTCIATNPYGSTTSTGAAITLATSAAGPTFDLQIQSQGATIGSTVTLTVDALNDTGGTSAFNLEWYHAPSGTVDFGVIYVLAIDNYWNGPSYTITNVQPANGGAYFVIGNNQVLNSYNQVVSGGIVDSQFATLTVTSAPAPVFSLQPANQTAGVGSSVTFSAAASGSPTYQWSYNGIAIQGAAGSSYTISNVQSYHAGNYTVAATSNGITTTSNAAKLTVNLVSPPAFTVNAVSQTVATGHSAAFSTAATGVPTPTCQWTLNGSTTIPGATITTDPILWISGTTSADAGTYVCTATNGSGTATSTATLTVTTTTTPGYLTNLSGRGQVGSGAVNALTGGFNISGTGSKQLLLRGIGPGLNTYFGVTGELTAADLTLNNSAKVVIDQNQTWGGTTTLINAEAAVGAFSVPNNSLDSMLYDSEPVGGYTAAVSGMGSATGLALVEIYDADANPPAARLINLSVRAPVGTGPNIIIGGFVIGGSTAETLLIRAMGPGLNTYFGLSGYLVQPVLTLYNSSQVAIYSNTIWGGDPVLVAAQAQVGAYTVPTSSQDSMLLVTLPAGGYSAQVSGVNSTTGIATVEIYEL